jgi:hypothetical protein
VRAFGRFRSFLPAAAIPICAVAIGIAVQAAAFGRASADSLVATEAVRGLVQYNVMRGTETLGGRPIRATCVQGSFLRPGGRGPAHGALVLLGNGERLYDVGWGVRRLFRGGRSRPAGRKDRLRFVLAGCPNYLGNHVGNDLVRGRPLEAFDERSDGAPAAAIVVGSRHEILTLDVARFTQKPLALTVREGRIGGASDLAPGGGPATIRLVRRAFDLPRPRRHG